MRQNSDFKTEEARQERVDFLGLPIDNLTMEETILKITDVIASRQIIQHVVINALKTVQAHGDSKIRGIINEADLINADGQAVVWASRILGTPLKERVAGVDLMQRLIVEAATKGWRVYCLGATSEVNNRVLRIYKSRYPGLQILGHHGYFSAKEEMTIVESIKESKADILLLGISSPMKEIFINKYLQQMAVPFCMGVGGSFDIVAGKTQRAPVWMQQSGLEWLYRVYQEPGRMWKRYARTNSLFLYLVFKEKIKRFFFPKRSD
ncbi:MAG: WecB/TagA/CpsF family glycosyltransferase [Calditrichia bacterium]